jgi:hypothetical protein
MSRFVDDAYPEIGFLDRAFQPHFAGKHFAVLNGF